MTEVGFEMISDDFNKTLHQLDSLRARKPKFICVNDDMDDAPPPVQQILKDFYMAYFPIPSAFELPPGTTQYPSALPRTALYLPQNSMIWIRHSPR